MLIKEIKLNLVPFGHRGKDKKEEFFPSEWKKYQTKLCTKRITETDNVVLVTGKVPGQDYQIVVLDFDGDLGADDYVMITEVLSAKDMFSFFEVQYTANYGFHFIYLCDLEVEIRNVQDRVLKPMFSPRVKKVDVRANGGFVFYHPTEFLDGAQEYTSYFAEPGIVEIKLVSSKKLQEFINSLYTKPPKKKMTSLEDIVEDVNILVNENLKPLRLPLRKLLMKGAIDIEDLSANTGEPEQLYWKALWLEVLNRNVSVDLVKRRLVKYQAHYDEPVTNHQIEYLYGERGLWKPFKNETLERMFPGWEAPKKKRGFTEWRDS